MGLTELATARFLGVLGPLQVPGYDQPVSQEGFDERTVYEVFLKQPPDTPRKKFLVNLANVLFDRLLHLPADQVPAVATAIDQSIGAGDIQLWFADPGRQAEVAGAVVAGALPRTKGDFLLLADTNLSASKANLGVVKHLDYRVRRQSDGRLAAHLRVDIVNKAPASIINPFYASYLRLYVPLGSELRRRPRQGVARATDGPYEVFSQRALVSPQGEEVVDFDYLLPSAVAPGGEYRLTWLRQAGTPRDVLRATIGGRTAVADPRQRTLSVNRALRGHSVIDWIRDHSIIGKLQL
jgi:hypothetical protein